MTPPTQPALKLPLSIATQIIGGVHCGQIIDAKGRLIAAIGPHSDKKRERQAEAMIEATNREPEYRAALEELLEMMNEMVLPPALSERPRARLSRELETVKSKAAALLAGGESHE